MPDDFLTIQSAIDAASPGAIIQVRAGTDAERIVITTSGLRLHGSQGVVLDGSSLGGIGIHVLGTSTEPVIGVELSGLEVTNFERGIVVQWASAARIHGNDVHNNLDRTAPLVLGEATGIELVTTTDVEVSQNRVHHNGEGGIQLRVGATRSLVRRNWIFENGTQRMSSFDGRGVLLTGAATSNNQILENEISWNYGRGVMLARPAGSVPIGGNVIAQNRVHGNYRGGIALMDAVSGNTIVQNDARDNNLSGLAPCYRCNLLDLSVGGNTWERNLGTFNLADPACLQ